MLFLANRANLDRRTLLTRIHTKLQTQVPTDDSPLERVWYHTSAGNKVGVRARLTPDDFLGQDYPVDEAELQVSFDFPASYAYDFYRIQWVEPERAFMIGWHQDETHMDLGECHLQLEYEDETRQREPAAFLDMHPLNVFDQRIDDLVAAITAITWDGTGPHLPTHAVR